MAGSTLSYFNFLKNKHHVRAITERTKALCIPLSCGSTLQYKLHMINPHSTNLINVSTWAAS